MKYLNEILIDWGENTADNQNNIITVSEKDLNPEEIKLRIWMKTYYLPESETDAARIIKKKYFDNDALNLNIYEESCCTSFEAFAMIACLLYPDSPDSIDSWNARDLRLWDYSWFDGNLSPNGQTIGDYCIHMAGLERFQKDFNIIYSWIEKYDIPEDIIWHGWAVYDTILKYPQLEPKWKERYNPEDILEWNDYPS